MYTLYIMENKLYDIFKYKNNKERPAFQVPEIYMSASSKYM